MNPRHALAETTNAFPGKDNRGCDTVRVPHRKGTCLVVTVAPRRPRIEFRADDPTLTPNGGLALVAQTCRVLDVIGTIERHVGPIKARRRGAGAGELLVGLAECMLAGGDFFTDLDPMRADVAGAQLRAVAEPPASTTAVGLGRRFGPDQLAGLRTASRSRRRSRGSAATCWRCARRSTWTRPTSRSTARARSASAGATSGCGPAGRCRWCGPSRGWCSPGRCWPGTRTCARTPRR